MYLYMITNLINKKRYIGITNNPEKRWYNHKCCNDPSMAIARAIKKYGADNFKFEVLLSNIPIEQIDEYEQEYIKKYHTHVSEGQGYNVAWGGMYNSGGSGQDLNGVKNPNAHLTEEEVRYIKDHRDIPEYVLFEKFCDKITYGAFRNVYLNKTYQNIPPTVDIYPYNTEFSAQFSSGGKLTYEEVVELRELYAKLVPWKEVYKKYQTLYPDPLTFWNIYNGNRYKLVCPEVFTEENKKAHTKIRACQGEQNGRAKITWEDVRQIRYDYEHGIRTRKELQEQYASILTKNSINGILRYDTWKE